jgi:hypothetical protein
MPTTYDELDKSNTRRGLQIMKLEEDVKYLLGIVDYYFKRIVPKGLDPTAYVTLTYEGDKEISDRIEEIRRRAE